MLARKFLNILFVTLLFSSCQTTTEIYYHDTRNFDGGEIWGDNIVYFFKSNPNIKITQIRSNKLRLELDKIKKEVVENGFVIDKDDSPYEFAFIINNQDTLYSNGLIEWRYKNIKAKIPNNIKEYLKAPDYYDLTK